MGVRTVLEVVILTYSIVGEIKWPKPVFQELNFCDNLIITTRVWNRKKYIYQNAVQTTIFNQFNASTKWHFEQMNASSLHAMLVIIFPLNSSALAIYFWNNSLPEELATCLILVYISVVRGAARIFLRGEGWNYGSKSYEKEKLLVIRIARKAHILWINSWLYSPRNLGSFQLNCHLVSLIFFHDDRKTQPTWLHVSTEFCCDLWFFSTVGKHISHVHVFFVFAKFKKRIKLLCAKLVVLTCLMKL